MASDGFEGGPHTHKSFTSLMKGAFELDHHQYKEQIAEVAEQFASNNHDDSSIVICKLLQQHSHKAQLSETPLSVPVVTTVIQLPSTNVESENITDQNDVRLFPEEQP